MSINKINLCIWYAFTLLSTHTYLHAQGPSSTKSVEVIFDFLESTNPPKSQSIPASSESIIVDLSSIAPASDDRFTLKTDNSFVHRSANDNVEDNSANDNENLTKHSLPDFIKKPVIFYSISGGNTLEEKRSLALEVETALHVWLYSLGLTKTELAQTKRALDADLLINFSDAQFSGRPFLGRSSISDSIAKTHLIDIDPAYRGPEKHSVSGWTTLDQVMSNGAVTISVEGRFRILSSSKRLFGENKSPRDIARMILEKQVRIHDGGDRFVHFGEIRRLAYTHIFRRIGSILGMSRLIQGSNDLFPTVPKNCELLLVVK